MPWSPAIPICANRYRPSGRCPSHPAPGGNLLVDLDLAPAVSTRGVIKTLPDDAPTDFVPAGWLKAHCGTIAAGSYGAARVEAAAERCASRAAAILYGKGSRFRGDFGIEAAFVTARLERLVASLNRRPWTRCSQASPRGSPARPRASAEAGRDRPAMRSASRPGRSRSGHRPAGS